MLCKYIHKKPTAGKLKLLPFQSHLSVEVRGGRNHSQAILKSCKLLNCSSNNFQLLQRILIPDAKAKNNVLF